MSLREKVRRLVEARRFQHTIMAVIVLNAATLGAETSPALMDRTGGLLSSIDRIALSIFVVELLLKLYVYRLSFFRDPWNCFDLVVVGIAVMPATGAFSVLRALRVLRVLRLISVVPSMRRVVSTLLAAIPGVSSIVALLVLVVYVGAVMATKLFGEVAPQYFGNLGQSLWTLFQVMTGESWPEVADAVMEQRPMAWIFFLIFILISTFVVLNLFLAVMVNAMETVRAEEAEPPPVPAQRVGPGQPDGQGTTVGPAGAPDPLATTPVGTATVPVGTASTPAGTASAGTAPAGAQAVSGAEVAEELAALRREVMALRRLLDPETETTSSSP